MTGKLTSKAQSRDLLASILLRAAERVSQFSGCHAYIVLEDQQDENAVWVFEMWESLQAHDESLKDEQVRALIAEAMPLLSGAPGGSRFRVAGGYGIN